MARGRQSRDCRGAFRAEEAGDNSLPPPEQVGSWGPPLRSNASEVVGITYWPEVVACCKEDSSFQQRDTVGRGGEALELASMATDSRMLLIQRYEARQLNKMSQYKSAFNMYDRWRRMCLRAADAGLLDTDQRPIPSEFPTQKAAICCLRAMRSHPQLVLSQQSWEKAQESGTVHPNSFEQAKNAFGTLLSAAWQYTEHHDPDRLCGAAKPGLSNVDEYKRLKQEILTAFASRQLGARGGSDDGQEDTINQTLRRLAPKDPKETELARLYATPIARFAAAQ